MKLDRNELLCYAVTQRYESSFDKLIENIERAIIGGATIIQLREKELSDEKLLNLALDINKVCKKYSVKLIINDNLYVAKSVDCAGIHIGQNDIDFNKVKNELGSDKVIGVSVQTYEQAQVALKNGADYLGIGAIFQTQTKDDAESVSIETLNVIANNLDIPVVAIGGIQLDNLDMFKGINIDGCAFVSAIFKNNDIIVETNKLVNRLREVL